MLKLKSYFVIGITISTCIPYANTIANSNVKGSKIHITSKANSFLDQNPSQKKIIINGIVRDAQQEPLIGVNIRIKGTGDGTISDLNGQYFLEVPNKQAILEFSYVGYETQEIVVGNQININ